MPGGHGAQHEKRRLLGFCWLRTSRRSTKKSARPPPGAWQPSQRPLGVWMTPATPPTASRLSSGTCSALTQVKMCRGTFPSRTAGTMTP